MTTFDDFYTDLANQALTYYMTEDLSPERLERDDLGTLEDFLSADIRDLYKNGNLEELFSYLEELNRSAYHLEADFLYENREVLADYISRAWNEYKDDDSV